MRPAVGRKVGADVVVRGAACCMALLALAACEKHEEVAVPVRPVLVVEIKPRTTQVFGPFAGSIEPRYQSNQGFRTSGRMVTRDVYVGDLVRKGDRLASLDETLLRFALTQAMSEVANAEAQLETADAASVRKRILARADVAPQADLDSASADQKTAAARLEQGRAALQRAQDNLGYAGLYAEFDGVVVAWNAEVGQDIGEGAGVVTLARPDIREAVADIPDDLIGKVREKASFRVELRATNRVTARGVVREIAPSSDGPTRTRRVRFTLDDASDAFRIGSTVSIASESSIAPRIEIPASAILEADGRTTVWVVAPGQDKIAKRQVEIVERGTSAVAVSGIGAGDRVVVAGIHRLKDGQAVRVATSFP